MAGEVGLPKPSRAQKIMNESKMLDTENFIPLKFGFALFMTVP